jgi:quinol monooxygenase YgiN
MWAQVITMRIKAEKDTADVMAVVEQLWATEQPGSGLLRSTAMRDLDDPSRFLMMVVFESEEQARARESDPRRDEGLAAARAAMAEVFDGPPEYTNLEILGELLP